MLLDYLEANHSNALGDSLGLDPEGISGEGVSYDADKLASADDENALKNDELQSSIDNLKAELEALKEGEATRSTSDDKDPDLTTVGNQPVGRTSVTYQTIIREPSEAVKQQEKFAAEQLRQARMEKARQKKSLLRRRQEVFEEVGIGRKVLSGEEQDLDLPQVDTRISEATGRRRGRSRGSLITGSRGGIGFYSNYT